MIITVGRQIGSGGHDIAKKHAEALNYSFFDMEILSIAAKESGFDRKFFEKNDEKRGFFRNIFGGSVAAGTMIDFDSTFNNSFSQEGLFRFQAEAIRKAAKEGNCVFVGRCSDYILRDFPELLNIFISADHDVRVERVMKRMELSREHAEKFIREKEDSRSTFYSYYTGKKWGHSSSYDLCINSSRLDMDNVVELIKCYMKSMI